MNKDSLFRSEALRARFGPSQRRVLRIPGVVRSRTRAPVILQTTTADCGAACLAMALQALGSETSLAEVQDAIGLQRDGTDFLTLVAASRAFNVEAEGVRVDLDDLRWLPPPMILHWGFNHFVLLDHVDGRRARLIDPAIGRRVVSMKELSAEFTGAVLVFDEAPLASGKRTPRSAWRHYIRVILGRKTALLKILSLSGLLQLVGLGLPVLTAIVVDDLTRDRTVTALQGAAMGFSAMLVAYGVVTVGRGVLLARLQTALDRRIMGEYFEHLLALPFSFFQARSVGDLMMRASSNAIVRDLLSRQLLSIASDGILLFGYLVVLLVVNRRLGVTVLGFGLAQVLLALLAATLSRDVVQRELTAQSRTQSYLAEVLTAMDTVKAASAEGRVMERWRQLFVGELDASYRRSVRGSVVSGLLASFSFGVPVALLLIGAVAVMDGRLSVGQMLGFNVLAGAFLAPLSSLVANTQALQVVGTHLGRIEEIRCSPTEGEGRARPVVEPVTGGIALRDVSFRYGAGSEYVVKNVSLSIRGGQFVALIGPSGCGKSTLLKLLAGLHDPSEGEILLDNVELRKLDPRSVRAKMGIVLQRSMLFADTIRRNIALRDPDASMDRVEWAARIACIAEDIEAMTMGYDTVLSEGGRNVSGGQRQRLCLARAVLGLPRVLILDEATSEVDELMENAIQASLRGLACTKIVVSHRLKAVREADQLLVMARGTIVEQGTHDDLLRAGGEYARLTGGGNAHRTRAHRTGELQGASGEL